MGVCAYKISILVADNERLTYSKGSVEKTCREAAVEIGHLRRRWTGARMRKKCAQMGLALGWQRRLLQLRERAQAEARDCSRRFRK